VGGTCRGAPLKYDATSTNSVQGLSSTGKNLVNPLRDKGFPHYNFMQELVGGTGTTGDNAFHAGQPTPVPLTQDAAASAPAPYEAVIDPRLLENSGMSSRVEIGPKDPQVTLNNMRIHYNADLN
jgi:hypothetical protein